MAQARRATLPQKHGVAIDISLEGLKSYRRRAGRPNDAAGNPAGGPVGSHHPQQLNSEFIAALLRDFRHGGPKAIERVRRAHPAAYLKVGSALAPSPCAALGA